MQSRWLVVCVSLLLAGTSMGEQSLMQMTNCKGLFKTITYYRVLLDPEYEFEWAYRFNINKDCIKCGNVTGPMNRTEACSSCLYTYAEKIVKLNGCLDYFNKESHYEYKRTKCFLNAYLKVKELLCELQRKVYIQMDIFSLVTEFHYYTTVQYKFSNYFFNE